MPWTPLFEGDERRRCRLALVAAANYLREPSRHGGASLGDGAAGEALCLAHVATALEDGGLANDAVELLGRATGELEQLAGNVGLARGLAGVGWVQSHLERELGWPSDGGTEEIDELLAVHLDRALRYSLGLHDGISGIGLYFLERLGSPLSVRALERILVLLADAQAGQGLGRTWHTPVDLLDETSAAEHPFGHYDFGLANGIPGILGFAGAVASTGVGRSLATGIVRRGVPWLLSKRTCAPLPLLPRFHGTNVRSTAGEDRWACGSAAIAAVLLQATDSVAEAASSAELLAWLERLAGRPDEALPGRAEAGWLAGSAGIGHVYNRLFQQTGDERYARRARRWLRHTLETLLEGPSAWLEAGLRSGLMSGLSGMALAVLAASTDEEPAWDRLLLLGRPRSPGA